MQYELDFSFRDYVNIMFDVPMIFSNNDYLGDKTFREFFDENDETIDVYTISSEYLEVYWKASDHKNN